MLELFLKFAIGIFRQDDCVLFLVSVLVSFSDLSAFLDEMSVTLSVLIACSDLCLNIPAEQSSCELRVSLRVCIDCGFSVWPLSVSPSRPETLV